jgi:SAM-dependent methyltransferase
MSERAEALQQYQTSAPFKVRRDTHRLYSEREVDLDAESARALGLTGVESLLDVGCGPGGFLRYLRGRDHQGRLVAFDQSDAMLAEALAHAGGVQGNAEHLPFRDATFDAVSARHMLYHVPDIPAAVRELGRVARPGAPVLAMTTSGASYRLLDALGSDAMAHFGFRQLFMGGERFLRENARDYLDPAFERVDEILLENALVFRDPAPIVAYLTSALPSFDIPPGSDLWFDFHAWLRSECQRRLDAMGGVWRDPKYVAIFVCRGARGG